MDSGFNNRFIERIEVTKTITVNDKFQSGYTYELTAPEGQDYAPDFQPELTPQQMLALGVFNGNYFSDKPAEFPGSWWQTAKLSKEGFPDSSKNFFGVSASQPLKVWQDKGWIHPEDPRGWFQWYCRYYLGRRIELEDRRQIDRWRAFRRHKTQVENNCQKSDWSCRRRQRQALLHWAYDSRNI